MALKADLILKVICALAVILLASCRSVDVHQKSEPCPEIEVADAPSAAPLACGFRLTRACGYDLLYDADAGVYVVVGMPDGYYHDGSFYSLFGDGWQISVRGNGGWRPVALGLLPPGLQKKVYAKMYARILTNAQFQSSVFAKTPF